MGQTKYRKIPCGKPGCKNFSMSDGSGLCWSHNPAIAETRRKVILRGLETQKLLLTPAKRCAIEGCKARRMKQDIYCLIHSRMHAPGPAQILCKKENCRSRVEPDASGYCYAHSPLYTETRKLAVIARRQKRKTAPVEAFCRREGCKDYTLRGGSLYCYHHHPAFAEKRLLVANLRSKKARLVKVPPERACKIRGCKKWALTDGSSLCFHHQPAFRLKQRNRMLGKKFTLGLHLPWLGLKDINEARGLIFYSLIYDKPLLTLRALTKIASLHARGEVYVPPKPAPDPDDPL